MAVAELRRFSARFGPRALMDTSSRAYRDAGLAYMHLTDEEAFERLLANQTLLRLPLVRAAHRLAIGVAENMWRAWLIGGPDQ